MGEIRRAAVAMIGLAVLSAGTFARATSDIGPIEPTLFLAVGPVDVTENGSLELSCEMTDVRGVFYAVSARGDFGWGGSWGSGMWPYTGIRAGAGDLHVEVLPEQVMETYTGPFDDTWSVQAGETLRAALGIWGGAAECSMSLAGEPLGLTTMPPSLGAFLDESRFPTGAFTSVGGIGLSGAGIYERKTGGFLFAFLVSLSGATLVLGPEGQQYGGPGVVFGTWVTIAEPTNGLWRYALGAGAIPTLFILEMPA